jgi:2-(1,2-epoxy-1,2-dihydrophenyl)acetyl-CoA isomerase
MPVLLSKLQSGSLTLTLNRPERANSFNIELVDALQDALTDAAQDPQVRCIVITGTGNVFSAGQDISEMKQAGPISYRDHLDKTYNPLVLKIRQIGVPVIAAVNGPCAGAGLGIALACDLRIARSNAYFVVGFSGIGLAPDSGVSLLLPKHIGLGRAQSYFYTNKRISAHEALDWGMVNQVCRFGFETLTARVAASLAEGPAEAFALGKKVFNEAVLPNLKEVLDQEAILQEQAGKSSGHQEGVSAFFEKRKPKFH